MFIDVAEPATDGEDVEGVEGIEEVEDVEDEENEENVEVVEDVEEAEDGGESAAEQPGNDNLELEVVSDVESLENLVFDNLMEELVTETTSTLETTAAPESTAPSENTAAPKKTASSADSAASAAAEDDAVYGDLNAEFRFRRRPFTRYSLYRISVIWKGNIYFLRSWPETLLSILRKSRGIICG